MEVPNISSMLLLLFCVLSIADGGSVGVNYGRVANNLPSATKVVDLLKSQGVDRVKVYDTDPAVLKALSGSGIKVTVNLPNELLSSAARRPSFAYAWVMKNVAAYHPSTVVEAIAVGNEYNLEKVIKVSSPIALSALQNSYPSSAGSFPPDLVESVFKPMLEFLRQTGSSLMINVYPFFAYESNADVISLDYALFRENPGVVDAGNGLRRQRGKRRSLQRDLVRRVLGGGGTPLRPHTNLTVYLFALFNENKKPGPTSERNFGLFYPNEKKVYDIPLTAEGLKSYRDIQSPVTGGEQRVSTANGQTWCVAKEEAGKDKLQAGLDYACGEGGADCHPIQPGSTCFDPNTVEAHASFAFNSYYQKKGRAIGTCYFGGAAYIVTQQPRVMDYFCDSKSRSLSTTSIFIINIYNFFVKKLEVVDGESDYESRSPSVTPSRG
ncbi:UNVERIFIED_CONTAM: Glucan endo-1,3-beta-glucosidase 3 [Sesamum calycinum]|uniref:Glucan endo-1,3-beta-glucosidase 3 n=1 Tax=Sesamum calycinum TaxID=2727403 RepID=A0AAW2M8Z3_9LAMI